MPCPYGFIFRLALKPLSIIEKRGEGQATPLFSIGSVMHRQT